MSTSKFEYLAQNADEAIRKGLADLGLRMDDVVIEVLDAGSKGIFGFGGRQAKVALTVKTAPKETAPVAEEMVKERETAPLTPKEQTPAPVVITASPSEPSTDVSAVVSEADDAAHVEESADSIVNEETMKIASNVVRDLLERMRIKAVVESKISRVSGDSDSDIIQIDIQGNDLSYLIGRHSETLNALQYIASLIVGREVGRWVPLMIDVQGYRDRRERQLRQMATRMADQVAKSGRRIALEPMPSTERRVIHLALRDRTDITTESIGEEPSRKVVILPKTK